MKWNKLNYEAGYLDYLEGNMNEEEAQVFESFLDNNPELKCDLDLDFAFQKSSLVTFEKKEELYKKTWGDLTIGTQQELKDHLLEGKTTPMEEAYLKRYGFKELNQRFFKHAVAAMLILTLGIYFANNEWRFSSANTDFAQIDLNPKDLNNIEPKQVEASKSDLKVNEEQTAIVKVNHQAAKSTSVETIADFNPKDENQGPDLVIASNDKLENQKTSSNTKDIALVQPEAESQENTPMVSDHITAHINEDEVIAQNDEVKPSLIKKTFSIFSKKKLQVEVKDGNEDERYINVASSNFNYHRKIKK